MKADSDINKIYDELQSEYLLSYLYLGRFNDFNSTYVDVYPYFRTLGYKYEILMSVVYDKQTTQIQLQTLLETLKNNYPDITNPSDKIGNLNVQSTIYEKLGDLDGVTQVEKQTQEVYSEFRNSRTSVSQ